MKSVKQGRMPLNSYGWMHSEAKLPDVQKQTLIEWVEASQRLIQR